MSSQKIRAVAVAALEKKHRRVTAELLVREARSSKHPLHKDFVWDDKKAGHLHRLERAREIIASVRVVITTRTQKIRSVAYVRDPRAPPQVQGYVAVATLRDDHQYASEALDAEVARVVSSLERAREFAAAVGLEDELELALAAALKLHSRSRRGPPGQHVEERATAA